MLRRCLAALILALSASATSAEAEIYTYKDKNGTLVFTDRLAELPVARRRYYNRKADERKRLEAQREKALGKTTYERERAEAAQRAADERSAAQSAAAARNDALARAVASGQRRQATRDAEKKRWQKRARGLRIRAHSLYQDYKKTKTAYDALAIRAEFSLYPAQRQEKARLHKRLEGLIKDLKTTLKEAEQLPEQARKAGVPPGWIR